MIDYNDNSSYVEQFKKYFQPKLERSYKYDYKLGWFYRASTRLFNNNEDATFFTYIGVALVALVFYYLQTMAEPLDPINAIAYVLLTVLPATFPILFVFSRSCDEMHQTVLKHYKESLARHAVMDKKMYGIKNMRAVMSELDLNFSRTSKNNAE